MPENGSNGNGTKGILPEAIWQELKSLLDPTQHFYGEYVIAIHDSEVVRTERISRFRTLRVSVSSKD